MPEPVEFRTARLRLSPLDPEHDAPGLHGAYRDPDVMRWGDSPRCADLGETGAQLAAAAATPGNHLWALRPLGAADAIGLAGLTLDGTLVPNLTWLLRKDQWGNGFATEAAAAVVERAFGPMVLDRVEAWVESTNDRSLAVARRIGLVERGRLSQRYPSRAHPHETVVLGRSRHPEPTAVINAEVDLPVTDVAGHAALLASLVGGRVRYLAGDPPTMAAVGLSRWSAGPSLRLVAVPAAPAAPVTLTLDVGTRFATVCGQAAALGLRIVAPPALKPWGVRQCTVRLPDGHHLVLTAPA